MLMLIHDRNVPDTRSPVEMAAIQHAYGVQMDYDEGMRFEVLGSKNEQRFGKEEKKCKVEANE